MLIFLSARLELTAAAAVAAAGQPSPHGKQPAARDGACRVAAADLLVPWLAAAAHVALGALRAPHNKKVICAVMVLGARKSVRRLHIVKRVILRHRPSKRNMAMKNAMNNNNKVTHFQHG